MTLRELREAVEAGQWDFKLAYSVFGIGKHATVFKAFDGSLDAAKRLHDALLPGMFWNIGHLDQPSLGYVCTVADGHFADSRSWRGYAIDPARAWLIAILRALEEEGRDG